MTTSPPASSRQRSKLWLWIVLPLIVALLSCLGAVGGGYLAGREARSGHPTALDPTPGPSGSASSSPVAAETITVRLPATLLGRAKTTDRTLLNSAEKAVTTQRAAESAQTKVAATYYGTFARKNLIFVLAVQGKVVDPQHLYATVAAALETQRKGLKLTPIDPGSLGGYAACGDSVVSGGTVASCLWVDAGSYAFVEFFGVKAASVRTQLIQARGQLEAAK